MSNPHCRFQSEDSVDSTASGGSVDSTGNSSTGRTSGTGSISVELSRVKPVPQVGYESVLSRKAAFEVHSDENLCKCLAVTFEIGCSYSNVNVTMSCILRIIHAVSHKVCKPFFVRVICHT